MVDEEKEKNVVGRAAQFALAAHGSQLRKWTDEPYFVHLAGVAKILKDAGCDDETIAVGYLHDVVEDTEFTVGELVALFGRDVADDVVALTNVAPVPGLNRSARKALDRARLGAASARAQGVKCADVLDNGDSIVANDKKFARVFLSEIVDLLPALDRANPTLRIALSKALVKWVKELDGVD